MNNRKKNINLVCDQVNGWSKKVANKLNIQLQNKSSLRVTSKDGHEKSMSELFAGITEQVCLKLEEVIAKKQQEIASGNYREGMDIYNDEMDMDFASQEFIDKNIRVRPASGLTNRDGDEQRSDFYGAPSKIIDGGDDAIKHEQDALIEMNQDRNKLKAKLEAQIQEKVKAQMMAESAKIKKKKD